MGRRLKDNIKIKFEGISSEHMNGRTKKLKEIYVQGKLSILRPQYFVFHFALYEYRDDIYTGI